MIEFIKRDNLIILKYTSDHLWVVEFLGDDLEKEVPIRKGAFLFKREDILMPNDNDENDVEEKEFIFGVLNESNGYYKIEARKLGITQPIFIYNNIEISEETFITTHSTPIFKKISEIVTEDIYIGGNKENSIPIEDFNNLLNNFPTPYELKKYINARMSVILKNYFDSSSREQEKYDNYMNRRQSLAGRNLSEEFKPYDLRKYETVLEKLKYMLANENNYNEHNWQDEIIQIILLLYPKYIRAFKGAPVRDTFSNKDRFVDFLLVDSNGNVDIIEIKKPFENKIMTSGVYRDNHIPMRDLSGAVMQTEKYIFYLNRSGEKGEEKLTLKYTRELPPNFKVKITNPIGMIIMGRDDNLSKSQLGDFEVVKRKYKNIVDIITYDDLIKRLEFIIASFQ